MAGAWGGSSRHSLGSGTWTLILKKRTNIFYFPKERAETFFLSCVPHVSSKTRNMFIKTKERKKRIGLTPSKYLFYYWKFIEASMFFFIVDTFVFLPSVNMITFVGCVILHICRLRDSSFCKTTYYLDEFSLYSLDFFFFVNQHIPLYVITPLNHLVEITKRLD